MVDYLSNPYIIASGITVSFLIAGSVLQFSDAGQLDENLEIEWQVDDFDEEPPEPLFNRLDTEECIVEIERFYEEAMIEFEEN